MNLKSYEERANKLKSDRSVNKLSERINKIDYRGISGTATTTSITGKYKDY